MEKRKKDRKTDGKKESKINKGRTKYKNDRDKNWKKFKEKTETQR